ncbi:hypothetical protein MMC25_003586 [Agyrium rufum]|nr:hypothetical protein [Agyrium rufum]
MIASVLITSLLLALAYAKSCLNRTVSINVSARTGVFDITIPQTNLEATAFILNYTQQGRNFTDDVLTGYKTTRNTYQISTQLCFPTTKRFANPTIQILTHGIGWDKTYWDPSYNNFKYSYVNVATDLAGYYTLTYDRLGIGKSSHGDALNEIQSFLEVNALAELSMMLRNGTFPGISHAFSKIVHVGHSFGSVQSYALADKFSGISDGLVLTGFSTDFAYANYFIAGGNFVPAGPAPPSGSASSTSKPKYTAGYLEDSDVQAVDYQYFLPGYFDPGALQFAYDSRQPVTVGELLTFGSVPPVNSFKGPVLVLSGSNDLVFCGGNCLATGNANLSSILAAAQTSFPNVPPTKFETYIQ